MVKGGVSEEQLCKVLYKAIIDGDDAASEKAALDLLGKGYKALDIIKSCMVPAMKVVGDMFARLEIFLPEVMMSADAFEACMKHLGPKILEEERREFIKGKVVIGTIQGDIHDLGKNIVALMLKANGFEVYDLGRDVPVDEFIKKAREVNADIIAVSALLSTSLPYIKDLVKLLNELGLRDRFKLMVGGGAVTKEWAEKVGAEGYGEDAEEAVRVALKLLGKE